MKLRRTLLAGSSAVAAMIAATAVQAQTAPAAADSTQLEEITVTATKRETNLQDTPIAISAFGQSQLDRNQVKDVTDLAKFVPSMAINQQGDQGAILITMRGIGNDTAYTEVADPEVAIYVDGIYSPRAQGAAVLMYDVDAVEVARGPQGTLFGRNATVGAVSIRTAKPTLGDYYGNAEVVAGSYNRLGARFAVNLPVSDTFALRLAAITERHDGYVDFQRPPTIAGINPSAFVTDGKKYYAQDQRSARLSALWKPNEKFSWNVNVEGYQDTGAPVIALAQNPRAGQKKWSALIDTAPVSDRFSYGVRSTMDYSISDKVGLTYVTGWQRVGGNADSDADGGILGVTQPNGSLTQGGFGENNTVWSRNDAWSHEIQLKSQGENTVDWIVGGYYSHEDNSIRFDIDGRDGYRDGPMSWSGSFIQAKRTVESKAAFGQAVWHVNDRLRVTAGLRYTDDTKQDQGGRNVTFNGLSSCLLVDTAAHCNAGIFGQDRGATADQLLALLGPGYSIGKNDVKGSWDKFTWLGRADFDVTDDVLAYASVSTGFKSGNIEDGGLLANPETITNYEAGSKIRFLDGRATLNLAAYYEDFKGYQVNQVLTTFKADGTVDKSQVITTNAKGAQAYGFEAELAANLTAVDRLQISATYQDTKLDELTAADGRIGPNDAAHAVQLKGNQLPHAPHFSGTVAYEHTFELANGRIVPRIATHFESKSWLSYFNQGAPDQQKSYTRTDVTLRYEPAEKPWSVEAFVQNLENKNIKTGAGAAGVPNYTPVWTAVYQAPRTWGFRLKTKF
ncbi:TonB-dependent receptor [Caulobacter soli]|uniref:TonB-dependent receptor n=1 Tax=Caulobacter soli TaxID=2708539 RepID=UPI0013EB3130|nr:TonB-dependent receptor [Caulobacter soli]